MIEGLKSFLKFAWKSFNCLLHLCNLFLRRNMTVLLCDVSDIYQIAFFAIKYYFVALKAYDSRSFVVKIYRAIILTSLLLLENVWLTE